MEDENNTGFESVAGAEATIAGGKFWQTLQYSQMENSGEMSL